jgi:predicted DNA-binding protein (MmcQ/YjbR family)
MTGPQDVLAELRKICLALPGTAETLTWGEPHFRVADKIFVGFGIKDGKATVGFKVDMLHADLLVAGDPRFTRAPYVGHKGWVSMDVTGGVKDWEEVRALILESYCLIAPRKLRALVKA